MWIRNLRRERSGDRCRVAADVTWEETDRAPRTVYVEGPDAVAGDLEPSADAFVLAAVAFASWLGERRIRVEGAVCPRLRDGLGAVLQVYGRWFARCRPVTLEPTRGFVAPRPRREARTASFLSGGVDGLAALRANRLDYPRDHPASIRDGLLLFGANDFELQDDAPVPARLAAFERLTARLEALAAAEELTLIPLRTNVRHALCPDYQCWMQVGFAAANIAVAHTLGRRMTAVLFASDGVGPAPSPCASHPLVDQHFSSAALAVVHEHAGLTRQDKLRMLAAWEPALALMQPCHYIDVPPDGQINCGRCEKCVRTMLDLIGLGVLARTPAFAEDDVAPEWIEWMGLPSLAKVDLLAQSLPALRAAGRIDLVDAVERRLARARRELGAET